MAQSPRSDNDIANRPQGTRRIEAKAGADAPGMVAKKKLASLDCSPWSSAKPQISDSNDPVSRHSAFHQDAVMAYQRAADGSKKDAAGLQLSIADNAAMRGHEVDFLLAIHRAMCALK